MNENTPMNHFYDSVQLCGDVWKAISEHLQYHYILLLHQFLFTLRMSRRLILTALSNPQAMQDPNRFPRAQDQNIQECRRARASLEEASRKREGIQWK